MTQLTDKLIAVLVPEDAKEINNNLISHQIDYNHIVNSPFGNLKFRDSIILENFWDEQFKIIGTITLSGEFDFDCEKYVESTNDNPLNASYFNYEIGLFNKNNLEFCKEESFISLLNSKGIFLEKLEGQKILILEKL